MSIFDIQKYIPRKYANCPNLLNSENGLDLSYARKIQFLIKILFIFRIDSFWANKLSKI